LQERLKQHKLQNHVFYSRAMPNEREFSFHSPIVRDAKGKWCILPDMQSCQDLFNTVDIWNKGQIDIQQMKKALTELTGEPLQERTLRLLLLTFGSSGSSSVSIKEFTAIYHYIIKVKTIYEDIQTNGTVIASEAMMEPLVDSSDIEAHHLFKYLKKSVKHFTFEGFLISCIRFNLLNKKWKDQVSDEDALEDVPKLFEEST